MFACLMFAPIALMAQSLTGDWKISAPDEDGAIQHVQLSIKADNSYQVDFGMDGTVEVEGKMSVTGDKMTIQDTGGAMACTGENSEGVYSFRVDATSMTMTKISDGCEGRGGPDGMTFSKM